ncbi:hypothetical protein [Pseudomonas oryzae]|uniref:hypothetical protein n=1 Tax=Pseudomonas oryzae TaxID=1392877 RepID=UPI0012FD86B3|nr:hypothetical protein [Pseudomonas oryzae]
MIDLQCCHQAATASACPAKVTSLIAPRHLELIHKARQALHRATNPNATDGLRAAALPAWQTAAESLTIAPLKHAEQLEARHD